MRTKLPIISSVILFFVLLLAPPADAVTFRINPQTQNLNVNETLNVVVEVDTQGQQIIGAEAVLNFDPNLLQFVGDSTGSFLANYQFKNQSPGTVAAGGYIDTTSVPKTGSGTLTTLTFTALSGGNANLSFACGGDVDSKIFVPNPSDPGGTGNALNCASLNSGSYPIAGPTAGPTAPGSGTAGPSPTRQPGGPAQTCDICGKCEGKEPPPDWQECANCLAKDGYTWTVVGCLPTSPGGFAQAALKILTSVVGGISFLSLLYGGFLLLSSRGSPDRLEQGKSVLVKSIVGLLLTLFAVFLLQFIGVQVLSLPGFG